MKNEVFFQRHWAETVRLYSGLLENEERIEFIKFIANNNILLACECRSTSFYNENDLDSYLVELAIESAKQFNKSLESARGILALAELNRYEEIIQIFSSINENEDNYFHSQVVINYVSNGNEFQIAIFLNVLSKTNKKLFQKAIDKAFEIDVVFTTTSVNQAKKFLEYFFKEKELLLAAKTICAFQIKDIDLLSNNLLDVLLINKQIKYAFKLINLFGLKITDDIFRYLDLYIHETQPKLIIQLFLSYCRKYNINIRSDLVRKKLSIHLNPQVKYLALEVEDGEKLSTNLIYEICLDNINIANKSSIEFSLHLIEKFNLHNKVSIENIVDSLFINPKPQKLELAYKIILTNNLSNIYSYELLFYYLINTFETKSLILARHILNKHFQNSERIEKLFLTCCVIKRKLPNKKLIREIILNDLLLLNSASDIKKDTDYLGVISLKFRDHYMIEFSPIDLKINVPMSKIGKISYPAFIKFRFINITEKIIDSKIQIINTNVFENTENKIFYKNYFIGQILTLEVSGLNNSFLYLHYNKKNLNFSIHIKEISNNFIRDIRALYKIGQNIRAIIIGFDIERNRINCSIKAIQKANISNNNMKIKNKLEDLRNHFSNR